MSSINISSLLSNSFDWQTMVDELVQVESEPITELEDEQTVNTNKIDALSELETELTTLQESVQTLRDEDIYDARSVSSSNSSTTWTATSTIGAAIGSYAVSVTQLATATTLKGTSDIGSALSTSSNVSSLTLANLNTATAVTAGTFTVNGEQVTVALTDSLQDVFDAISTATDGDVTASYNSSTDTVSLTSASGDAIVLSATNDTSNFLDVFKLVNSDTSTVTSSSSLGTVQTSATLADSGLDDITSVDSEGDGSFTINGVEIDYNINDDTLATVISRINSSDAGVTASYDSANDRFVLTNSDTGSTGMGISENSGGLLGVLGLTGTDSTLTLGKNCLYSVDGGATQTSKSNTLDEDALGVEGLTLKVNTIETQTISIEVDAADLKSAIESFIEAFNTVQSSIDTYTAIDASDDSVTTAVLSSDSEVESWASKLQSLAFNAISGIDSTVDQLDDLGIDFDGTTGQLEIYDEEKLSNALLESTTDVETFFRSGTTGFVYNMYSYLSNAIDQDNEKQDSLNTSNDDLDDQIATLQARVDAYEEKLTSAFEAMQEAVVTANTQSETLTEYFDTSSSSS